MIYLLSRLIYQWCEQTVNRHRNIDHTLQHFPDRVNLVIRLGLWSIQEWVNRVIRLGLWSIQEWINRVIRLGLWSIQEWVNRVIRLGLWSLQEWVNRVIRLGFWSLQECLVFCLSQEDESIILFPWDAWKCVPFCSAYLPLVWVLITLNTLLLGYFWLNEKMEKGQGGFIVHAVQRIWAC